MKLGVQDIARSDYALLPNYTLFPLKLKIAVAPADYPVLQMGTKEDYAGMDQPTSATTAGDAEASVLAAGAAEPDALNNVAALLAEQLAACHAAAARCFGIANDEEEFQLPARMDALRLAARLVQASAVAASAVKRVKGGQFHHHVTVHRIDVAAEKAARKAREQAAKRDKGESRKLLEAEIDRIIAAALEEDAREKAESGTNPVGDRSHAHASAQRNEGEAA